MSEAVASINRFGLRGGKYNYGNEKDMAIKGMCLNRPVILDLKEGAIKAVPWGGMKLYIPKSRREG
jgi:hypothetical protein